MATNALRIGVAGLGTVGTGVVRLLQEHGPTLTERLGRPVTVTAVSVRDAKRDRGISMTGIRHVSDPTKLAADPEVDVLVELVGGSEGPAREAVRTALERGKPVVTANKALIANHGLELAKLAEAKGVALKFEAAVAGGIPVIKALRESLAANRIGRVYGILNGTCNYILTKMQGEGRTFADVLKEAQAAGYAEADPAFDVGGGDTAHKLSILTSLAFGTQVAFADVHVEGIEDITSADIDAADELGYRIKLLGVALRTADGIEQRVHPTMVPKDSAIGQVSGVTNCVAIDADYAGALTLVGPGAGMKATASSVVSDIVDIARGDTTYPFILPVAALAKSRKAPLQAHAGGYYVRLAVEDKPGAFAAIATRMAKEGVSLESIMQRRPVRGSGAGADQPMPVVLITHETTEAAIRSALAGIEKDGHVKAKPQVIRIETLAA